MNPFEALRARTREKLLTDFSAFCKRAWREMEAKELQWGWYHELLAEYLTLAYQREELRLIFCMPPRGLKSRLTSIFWPSWCWANDPSLSFISVSYSDSLSEEHSVIRRKLLSSPWFQETFPNRVQFSSDQNRREQYGNLSGGMMTATSVEGTLTGKGSDFIVTDDILSPQQSFSDSERVNANRFFDSTLRSRLNEPTRGGIVIVCQRLHQADLVGHLLETEPDTWKLVSLPMVAERDEEIVFPISGRVVRRKAGELLHPSRFPKNWCDKQERTLGRVTWSAQYQQRPSPIEGNIVKAADVQYFGGRDPVSGEPDPQLPETFDRRIISVDASFKDTKSSDYVCILVIGVKGARRYVLNIVNSRLSLDATELEIRHAHVAYGPINATLIEDKSNGPAIISHLQDELPGVIGVDPKGGKLSRLVAASPEFSAKNWFFDRTGAWTSRAVDQLCSFPACKNDDIADAVSQASIWLQDNTYEYGLLDWFKNTSQEISQGVRNVFGERARKRAATVANAKPTQKSVNNFETSKEARPCPECGSTATIALGGPQNWHCNQCRTDFHMDGEIVQQPPSEWCNCIPEFRLWVKLSGRQHCNQCGKDEPRPAEATAAAIRRDVYLETYRSPFGRFGNSGINWKPR
jgi:predicted phage terminase large subunit-like protein